MRKPGDRLIIYQKPTCTTCRQTVKLVDASGRAFTTVNYYETPFTRAQLAALLKKAGLKPREAMRTKEGIYKTLGLATKNLSDAELIQLMVMHPDLIQRPLVESENTVLLARPAECVKRLLQ